MSRVGILTCDGDCPGLNAAIRAVARKLIVDYDAEVLGIINGFAGLIDGLVEPLSLFSVSGILPRGGTILGTSKINPFEIENGLSAILENMQRFEIESLVIVGGRDSIEIAARLSKEGVNVVCIPGTIDNDIPGTDMTLGFDTAVTIATRAIDMLHSTADSHHRVMVVEVMGRESGWIATLAGLAGGADCILIPEEDANLTEVAELLKQRHKRRKFSIVVVAEGAQPSGYKAFRKKLMRVEPYSSGYPISVGNYVGAELEKYTGVESRVTALGHLQRGGTPSVPDRILASRLGVLAAEVIERREFSVIVGLKGQLVCTIPLDDVTGKIRQVDPDLYKVASVFFG